MSEDRAEVIITVDTERFREEMRLAAEAVAAAYAHIAPLLRRWAVAKQRHRSRVVTRRKQRGSW